MDLAAAVPAEIDSDAVRRAVRPPLERSQDLQQQIELLRSEHLAFSEKSKRLEKWAFSVDTCEDALVKQKYACATEHAAALLAAVQARIDALQAEVNQIAAALEPQARACLAAHNMKIGDVVHPAKSRLRIDNVEFRLGEDIGLKVLATTQTPSRRQVTFSLPLKDSRP